MYIYKTTNIITKEFYVGKSSKPKFNPEYYGSGNRITRAIKDYGRKNFKVELLEEFDNESDLADAERTLIFESLRDFPELCMNISLKSNGGETLKDKTPEEISEINRKISDRLKGDNNGRRTHPDCLNGEKNGMWGKVSHNARAVRATRVSDNETRDFDSVKKLAESGFIRASRSKLDRVIKSGETFSDNANVDFIVVYV